MPNDQLRQGIALVICAPSGAGKSTLVRKLVEEFPELTFSVSCTTRAPRAGELDGRDYNFISKKKFNELKEQGGFAEYAEVHGHHYGTLLAPMDEALKKGLDLLFEIDIQGARQLKRNFPHGCYVFIFPPSFKTLRDRLIGRGTDSPETIARRLKTAAGEIKQADIFNIWIINDQLEQAYGQLRSAYIAATLSPSCRPGLAANLLTQWPKEP